MAICFWKFCYDGYEKDSWAVTKMIERNVENNYWSCKKGYEEIHKKFSLLKCSLKDKVTEKVEKIFY